MYVMEIVGIVKNLNVILTRFKLNCVLSLLYDHVVVDLHNLLLGEHANIYLLGRGIGISDKNYAKDPYKEIEIIHRLFLVITMYCKASSSQFDESLNLPRY